MTNKVCPNCGSSFAPGGRGLGKTFCQTSCRLDFNARAKADGAVIIALVKCHHQNRHAKAGTMEARAASEARRELAEIVGMMLKADETAGRPNLAGYITDMLAHTRYIDRSRKF